MGTCQAAAAAAAAAAASEGSSASETASEMSLAPVVTRTLDILHMHPSTTAAHPSHKCV